VGEHEYRKSFETIPTEKWEGERMEDRDVRKRLGSLAFGLSLAYNISEHLTSNPHNTCKN
jgi:hypothetical protein